MIFRWGLWATFFLGLITNIHRHGGGLKIDVSPQGIFFVFTSLLAVISFVIFIEVACQGRLQRAVSAVAALLFGLAFYYCKRTAFPFSYSLLYNNLSWVLHPEGIKVFFQVAHSTFFASDFFWSFLFSILVWLSFKKRLYDPPKLFNRMTLMTVTLVVIFFVSFIQPYSYDPLTNFLRSVKTFYQPSQNVVSSEAEFRAELPKIQIHSNFKTSTPPHVFVILVESFNSRFINESTPEGVPFTPFFNELTKKHLYFPHYFSNSIQTAKGHFAALCGQVPMLRSVEFKAKSCFDRKCAPDIMQEAGYQTVFIQADPNFDTDGEKDFLLNHGVQDFAEVVRPCKTEKDRCYGIGIRDDLFLGRALNYLTAKWDSKTPLFAILATVSSHMPFNSQEEEEREIFKNPKTLKEHYLNMLRMTDNSLKVFLDSFSKSPLSKNSILIITGDHGFPTGEHGSFHNENYAYTENFGVPLLIIDSRRNLKEKFSAVQGQAFSHLNLGPTIADLAGLTVQTDFIATSIFDPGKEPSFIPFVQPYSGGFQAVLRWPFRYIFEEHKEKEYLFNLEEDPEEKTPLKISDYNKQIRQLRNEAGQIYVQQKIFECP